MRTLPYGIPAMLVLASIAQVGAAIGEFPALADALLEGSGVVPEPEASTTKCASVASAPAPVVCVTGIAEANPVCTKAAYHLGQCTPVGVGGCHVVAPLGTGGECSASVTVTAIVQANPREWSFTKGFYWGGWKTKCSATAPTFTVTASVPLGSTSGAGNTDDANPCGTTKAFFDAYGGCIRSTVTVTTKAKGSTLFGTVAVPLFTVFESDTDTANVDSSASCPS